MAYIYALLDPRNGNIRYVGKTETTIKKRFYGHLSEARRGDKRYVYNWIRQLMSLKLVPIIKTIEECNTEMLNIRECYWIAYGKQQGWRLTNATDGGGGASGRILSEETKIKMSRAHKGNKIWLGKNHTDESKRRMSLSGKGRKHTKEARKKIGDASRNRSEETKIKTSESLRGVKHHNAKLTDIDVYAIRELAEQGQRVKDIAVLYGISACTVCDIKFRRTWAHLTDQIVQF